MRTRTSTLSRSCRCVGKQRPETTQSQARTAGIVSRVRSIYPKPNALSSLAFAVKSTRP